MPGMFTKLAPEAARLQTLFHRHLRDVSFVSERGDKWRVGSPGMADAPHGAALYGTFGGVGTTGWMIPDWKVAAASVLGVPCEGIEALPEQIRHAALECFAADVLSKIEQATGVSVSLDRLLCEPVKRLASACPFRIVREADGLGVSGAWTVASGGNWQGAVEEALSALPVRDSGVAEEMPVPAVVACRLMAGQGRRCIGVGGW